MFSFTKVNVSHKKTKRVHFNFCAICHESGLPEKEYTSHCVKDQPGPSGKIICPLLLSKKCIHCKEFGHISSRCYKIQLEKIGYSMLTSIQSHHTPRPRILAFNVQPLHNKPKEDYHYEKRKEIFRDQRHMYNTSILPIPKLKRSVVLA